MSDSSTKTPLLESHECAGLPKWQPVCNSTVYNSAIASPALFGRQIQEGRVTFFAQLFPTVCFWPCAFPVPGVYLHCQLFPEGCLSLSHHRVFLLVPRAPSSFLWGALKAMFCTACVRLFISPPHPGLLRQGFLCVAVLEPFLSFIE